MRSGLVLTSLRPSYWASAPGPSPHLITSRCLDEQGAYSLIHFLISDLSPRAFQTSIFINHQSKHLANTSISNDASSVAAAPACPAHIHLNNNNNKNQPSYHYYRLPSSKRVIITIVTDPSNEYYLSFSPLPVPPQQQLQRQFQQPRPPPLTDHTARAPAQTKTSHPRPRPRSTLPGGGDPDPDRLCGARCSGGYPRASELRRRVSR